MTSATTPGAAHREPELAGQTVVLIGGSAGIGLETARRARARVPRSSSPAATPAAQPGGAGSRRAAHRGLRRQRRGGPAGPAFFRDLPAPIDHVLVTAGGPTYGPLLEMDSAQVRDALSDHVVLGLEVARNAAGKMRPGGTLLLMGGTGGRRIGHGLGIAPAATAALPPFTAALALELAPVRVNLIAAGLRRHPAVGIAARQTSSKSAAMSCGRRSPSAVSSARPTSPRSPCTS